VLQSLSFRPREPILFFLYNFTIYDPLGDPSFFSYLSSFDSFVSFDL
jgi:hypothetical protein